MLHQCVSEFLVPPEDEVGTSKPVVENTKMIGGGKNKEVISFTLYLYLKEQFQQKNLVEYG